MSNCCGGGVVVNIGAGVTDTSQVSTGQYTSGVQVERREEVMADKNFLAGAYYVDIKPIDAPITVNGEVISPGGRYHRDVRTDLVEKTQDFVPAVSVEADGNRYWYGISYPSSADVTEADIANM